MTDTIFEIEKTVESGDNKIFVVKYKINEEDINFNRASIGIPKSLATEEELTKKLNKIKNSFGKELSAPVVIQKEDSMVGKKITIKDK